MSDDNDNEDRWRRWEGKLRIWEAQMEDRFGIWQVQTEDQLGRDVEMFRGIIAFGILALKSVILVNGAAAVALLAFLGHIWGTSDAALNVAVKAGESLGWFVAGTGAGVAAAGLAYITQVVFQEVGQRLGNIVRVFVVALGIVGLIDFAIGASEAVKAFTVLGVK